MKKGIIGKKLVMTQIFKEDGTVIPVTVIEAGPCVVSQKKTKDIDGYNAVQIGYGDLKPKKVKKAIKGHFEKSNVAPKKVLREFKFDNTDEFKVGDIIKTDAFEVGDKVDVVGTSKGKGYAGVIKRWNFRRLKETHGTGPNVRKGGSTGACASPARVFPGKKMSGHKGNVRKTIQNLEIAHIDVENNLIAIKGAVPGSNGNIVMLKDSIKA